MGQKFQSSEMEKHQRASRRLAVADDSAWPTCLDVKRADLQLRVLTQRRKAPARETQA